VARQIQMPTLMAPGAAATFLHGHDVHHNQKSGGRGQRDITICSIKKKITFFHRFFLAREEKIRWKNVFLFLSDMNFCFMKQLFPRPR
jgi:hypothetical protein